MTFQRLDQDLDDGEMRELERFLAAPGLEETSMDLYGIDGFFAAILANPRTLMPSEWMPWIWDADRGKIAPEFENLDEAQRILSLLMRHYNTVARLLMEEADRFVPLYEPGDSDAASAWCAGFLTGMRFDADAWVELLEGKPKWFAPILGLGSRSDDPAATEARRRARWTREVGASVAKIHAFWLEARRAQPPGVTADAFPAGSGPPSAKASQRTGRNDPCPCGSGRKFKRCCGASPAGLN